MRHVTDEERREFLKALGVGGTVAAGSVTLSEVRQAVSGEEAATLAPIGQAIQADLAGTLDASLIASQQATLAAEASALPAAVEKGLPEGSPREEFGSVAAAGRPINEHLAEVGFFESTTEHLPEFHPAYLESAVETVVGSEALAGTLEDIGFGGEAGVDLLATVMANAENMAKYHWVGGEIVREELSYGAHVPPMTKAAAGGVLLWLDDLDSHLWQKKVLLTDDILADAVWHGQSMAVGFHLMSEGAKAIAEESTTLSDSELAALFATGFAVQAIGQSLLPTDVYWVTEEIRSERQWTDLRPISE